MTTDDLRTRAREAAEGEYPSMHDEEVSFVRGGEPILREGFIAGYLAHAAQQPTREQIAKVLWRRANRWDVEYEYWMKDADAVFALLDGAGS